MTKIMIYSYRSYDSVEKALIQQSLKKLARVMKIRIAIQSMVQLGNYTLVEAEVGGERYLEKIRNFIITNLDEVHFDMLLQREAAYRTGKVTDGLVCQIGLEYIIQSLY